MNGNEHATRTSGTTDRSLTEEVEVAVVGSGPTGLTLAVMLSGYGIRTAVLDGAAAPACHSRAAVVHARTLEPLGVVDEMLGGGVVVPHFGVRDRDRLLLGVDFDGLPTTHPYTLMLPQDRTERILLGALPGLDLALTLVVPEHQEKRVTANVGRFRNLPVRVVPRAHLAHASLVRPDGYVAGSAAPNQHARLLELLAQALGV